MEARELRIGNLFYWQGHIHHVIGIIDWGQTEVHLNRTADNDEAFICKNVDELHPLPLTEEWLLRFGFEKRLGKFIGSRYTFGINPRTEDFILIIEQVDNDKQEFFYLNSFHPIKYVHQLQNLYHALTGQELVINANP